MNISMTISYDGTCFHGFQVQPEARTVQGEIEKQLAVLLGEQIRTAGSGRTDSGVHAIGQVINFKIKSLKLPLERVKIPLNRALNGEIYVRDACLVPEEFHSRFSAQKKTYVYWVHRGEMQPWLRNYCWFWEEDLDKGKLLKACSLFQGEHDFAGYSVKLEPQMETVRTVYRMETAELPQGLLFFVQGNGFLRGMVRMIVSAVLHCGSGQTGIDELRKQLEEPGTVNMPAKAPPGGLYLHSVTY